ncbi:MAG: hypothetical protein DMG99_18445 [Acidobacteria bacterium]|nr:MAG: hypothetical protein AUG89_09555 [Acidobacteria bacterium 13_1_20CM_4_56_7]PYQ38602.1 MAG: hypothetical protein DMG99_18445 [Acidobacteriota bacterium]
MVLFFCNVLAEFLDLVLLLLIQHPSVSFLWSWIERVAVVFNSLSKADECDRSAHSATPCITGVLLVT